MSEGAARSQHVVHVLPADDRRIAGIVRTQAERLSADPEVPGTRLLVLTPTAGEAAAIARDVNDGLDASAALLTPLTNATRAARRLSLGASCIVVPASLALALMQRSVLKLEEVETVVLVSLDSLVLGALQPIESILSDVPRTSDRVAITAELNETIESFLERHARRARRVLHDLPSPSEAVMEYVVCDERSRADVLGRLLDTIDPEHATVVSSEEEAEEACNALARLGYGPDDELVSYSDGEVPEKEPLVLLFGPPPGPDEVQSMLEAEPGRLIVLLAPADVTSFLRIFGSKARPVGESALVDMAVSIDDAVRDEVRAAIAGASVHREVLTLSPLFAERDPVEVAAALLRLYEQARSEAQASQAQSVVRVVSARVDAPMRESVSHERPVRARRQERDVQEAEFTPIYINVGSRDGAQKGDFVGAIAGESGISSDQIGKITLRDTFTIVEIASTSTDTVLEAINGKTIRGRVIAARPDRMQGASDAGGRGGRDSRERSDFGGRSYSPRRSGESGGRGGAGGRSAAGGRGMRGRTERGDRGERGERGGPPRGAGRPRRDRADSGGRGFREGGRGPRAIGESREWGERGERLRNARRSRRERDE